MHLFVLIKMGHTLTAGQPPSILAVFIEDLAQVLPKLLFDFLVILRLYDLALQRLDFRLF